MRGQHLPELGRGPHDLHPNAGCARNSSVKKYIAETWDSPRKGPVKPSKAGTRGVVSPGRPIYKYHHLFRNDDYYLYLDSVQARDSPTARLAALILAGIFSCFL